MSWRTGLLAAAAAMSLSATAFAQRGMGRGPMNYDAATEVTISGAVDEVKQMMPMGGGRMGGGGIHLMVATASGPVEVHVGPAAYVTSKNFVFAKGDVLTVTGSKVMMGGTEAVLAREITKGDQVLTLRDAKGFPLWSGRAGR